MFPTPLGEPKCTHILLIAIDFIKKGFHHLPSGRCLAWLVFGMDLGMEIIGVQIPSPRHVCVQHLIAISM